jgi:adenosylcobinamide kinase/adenosylcobinamide-phosphate guanylyltransferase
MRIFISGGCKNGKSSHALRLASRQRKAGKPLYYLATMTPKDEEDRQRIRRHRREREGWGFETVEICGSLRSAVDGRLDLGGSMLLDSVTALLSDAMFAASGAVDMGAHSRLADELLSLLRVCTDIVLVSDWIFSDAWRYEALTEAYRQRLAWLDRKMAEACDVVLEAAYGSLVTWKGKLWEGGVACTSARRCGCP